jgi:hypothetical protein
VQRVICCVGPLAQVVEQQPFKLWVDGSNPSRLIPRHLRISQNHRSDTAADPLLVLEGSTAEAETDCELAQYVARQPTHACQPHPCGGAGAAGVCAGAVAGAGLRGEVPGPGRTDRLLDEPAAIDGPICS